MKRLVGAALSLLACTEDQPPLRAAAVEAGGDFSCALLTDSTVACWGGNTRGQLGRGTYDDAPVTERAVVAGLAGVLQIAAGTSHACARLRDGTVRCWGDNGLRELGADTIEWSAAPVTVPGLAGVAQIAAGGYVSCALLGDGTVRCWGDIGNALRPQGPGVDQWVQTPTTIPGLEGITAITVSGQYTVCGVATGGGVRCWGFNGNGEIGDGTIGTTPDGHVNMDDFYRRSAVGVLEVTGAAQVALGTAHGCARLAEGSVRCWGFNRFAQCASNSASDQPVLTPRRVMGITNARQIDLGGHTSCALWGDRTVSCWGRRLGTMEITDPTAMEGLSGVEQLSVGDGHACAVLAGGTVQCWGDNARGQLGDGTTSAHPTPVAVR